jgi:5'-methylthioadenosine phosphorylase
MQTLGVIGGSGLYELAGLSRVREVRVRTPFGSPSDALVVGELSGTRLAFLPRHGRGHRLLPSEINFRANLWALRQVGATHVLSVSAVGSLREEIAPGHLVLPDQFIDLTRQRPLTFFGHGVVAHVGFGDPTCPQLRAQLAAAVAPLGPHHDAGTYVCIEGPAFSTRAESELYRSWGATVIGMTAQPEAKLAREAELCYATLALATDYDCWRAGHDAVTVDQVVATMQANVEKARAVIRSLAASLADLERTCRCGQALAGAVMTAPRAIDRATRRRLGMLLDPHLPPSSRRPAAPASRRRRRTSKER